MISTIQLSHGDWTLAKPSGRCKRSAVNNSLEIDRRPVFSYNQGSPEGNKETIFMSGHSKWSTIKRQKGLLDAKRSAVFGKLARQISLAARDGKDPGMNFKLRLAIDKAKAANLPNDNIERAIKAGAGENKEAQLKELVYEGFGPGQVAVIVQALTDNPNRTAPEVRTIFSKHGGTLGNQNSVAWMFNRRGVLRLAIEPITHRQEELTLGVIDLGADDVAQDDGQLVITVPPEKLAAIQDWLVQQGVTVESADVDWLPTTTMTIDEATQTQLHELLSALDDHDDVTAVASNEQ